MATSSSSHHLGLLIAVATLGAGCAGGASGSAPLARTFASVRAAANDAGPKPILIADDGRNGSLVFWPIVSGVGGQDPKVLAKPAGLNGALNMAADGGRILIANSLAKTIVVYDLKTKKQVNLPDSGGFPLDVAIGRDATIYAANVKYNGKGTNSVSVYPAKTRRETVLTCASLESPFAIAVDLRGNVFVNQNGTFTGVVEFPKTTDGLAFAPCKKLQLKAESLYASGIAVDPKTGKLLVLDSGDCAGGPGGTLTTYGPAYQAATGVSVTLNDYCPGPVRLNADSTLIFVGDAAFEGGANRVAQFSYPGGTFLGAYHGGFAGGFTTIPNTLPN